jgi:hypothetical protein
LREAGFAVGTKRISGEINANFSGISCNPGTRRTQLDRPDRDTARDTEVAEQMRENVVATMLNSRQWTSKQPSIQAVQEVGLTIVFR